MRKQNERERKRRRWIIQRHVLELLHTYRWDQSFNGWLLSTILWCNQSGNVERGTHRRITCVSVSFNLQYGMCLSSYSTTQLNASIQEIICVQIPYTHTLMFVCPHICIFECRQKKGKASVLCSCEKMSFHPITTLPASQTAGELVNVRHASQPWHTHICVYNHIHSQHNNCYLGCWVACMSNPGGRKIKIRLKEIESNKLKKNNCVRDTQSFDFHCQGSKIHDVITVFRYQLQSFS